jgi:DNA-binding NarL/FixJ family response regulator
MAKHKGRAALQLTRNERRLKPALQITPRQQEILRLVSAGHTNREIGESLDISVRTVEVHRFNLMRRLDVRNVAQLLRQAMRLSLLPRNFGIK